MIQLLIIGEISRAEAESLADWIDVTLQPADTKRFSCMAQAIANAFERGWIPDHVVVFQGWPDEYCAADLSGLLVNAPLARVTVCYGAWCESDGRTRQYWPTAVRVPMHSAQGRLIQEWRILCNEFVPDQLPLSASRDEVFAVDHPEWDGSNRSEVVGARVLVDVPDPAYRQYLVELLENTGLTAHRFVGDERPDAILFDADPLTALRRSQFCANARDNPSVPVVALTNSPYPETVAHLTELGATSILPKLCDQRRIIDAIDAFTHRGRQ